MSTKEFGKRKIPRNRNEFIDLVVPYINDNPCQAIEILKSYSKRKKRNPNKDFDTAPLLVYLAFRKNCIISLDTICICFSPYIDNIPETLKEDVNLLSEKRIMQDYQGIQHFLKKYIKSLKLLTYRCDLEVVFHPIEVLSKMISEYDSFNRSWQYGITNNRADICGSFLLKANLGEIINSAYQKVRIDYGLTPLLSKWKNEQILFDQIRLSFPDLVVIGQGSPEWLDGQRFDIWLPQIKLAIEYNGAQHYQPVDFFGGEAGYLRTKERDEQKRVKCIENKTFLIEVKEGYKFEDIQIEITKIKEL